MRSAYADRTASVSTSASASTTVDKQVLPTQARAAGAASPGMGRMPLGGTEIIG